MVSAGDLGWIEVYHSLPSWTRCFIVFKKDDGEWVPNAKYELVNASHVRPGFRAFRIKARKLEFYLTNGSKHGWDDNQGKNYHIGMPGRYVCGQGTFDRVGEADVAECERFLTSRVIELTYKPSTECKKMFVIYKADNKEWLEAPGVEMNSKGSGTWTLTIPSRTLEVAFTDGEEYWDSNGTKNYILGSPAKYIISSGNIEMQTEAPVPSTDMTTPLREMVTA